MNTNTVVIGVVMIVIGIFTVWIFCLGGLLILIGFIVMIVGLIQSDPRPPVTYVYGGQYAPPAQYGQYQQPVAPPGTVNFCQYCGHWLAPGALMCPGCGRRLG